MYGKVSSILIAFALVATMFVAIAPMEVEAGNTMIGYHFNETDFDDMGLSNGPADYAVHNGSITNAIGYFKVGYNDWFSVPNLNDGNGVDTPANWAHSASTPWSFTPSVHNYIAVLEAIDGVNGYSGANYTASTYYRPMSAAAEDYCPATNFTPIPTLSVQSDDGSTLVLEWKAQMEAFDTNYDLAADGYTTTMIRYAVYSNTGGSWAFLGYSDADCGDYNAAWNGQMTFTYAGWSGVGGGTWGFRVTPCYQWINYENDGNTYECTGMGPTLDVVKVSTKDLNVYMESGWNLIALPGDDTGALFGTASALAQSIEDDTGLLVLSIGDWESGWVDYIRRDGSGTHALISWHMSTDYALDNTESYLVYCADDSGEGDDFWWEGLSESGDYYSDVVGGMDIAKGWNNIAYPYGNVGGAAEFVNDNGLDYVALWKYDTESWVTDDGSGTNQTIQQAYQTAIGNVPYTMTNNSAGMFIRSSFADASWTPLE